MTIDIIYLLKIIYIDHYNRSGIIHRHSLVQLFNHKMAVIKACKSVDVTHFLQLLF